MRVTLTLIATAMFTTLAASAPSNLGENSVSRDSNQTGAVDGFGSTGKLYKRGVDVQMYETHYIQSRAIESLNKDFDEVFAFQSVDYEKFQLNQQEWKARLVDIERAAKGRLTEQFNLDKPIEFFKRRFAAMEEASLFMRTHKTLPFIGFKHFAAVYDLKMEISRMYQLNGALRTDLGPLHNQVKYYEDFFTTLKKHLAEEGLLNGELRDTLEKLEDEVSRDLDRFRRAVSKSGKNAQKN